MLFTDNADKLINYLEDGAAARHVRLEATLREGASARQI